MLQLLVGPILSKTSLTKAQYTDFSKKFDLVAGNTAKQWVALTTVVGALNQVFETQDSVEMYAFISKHGLQGVAEVASGALSEASKKIETNISARLHCLYNI
ncbi:hypothetical protein BCR43DRAFT_111679 [Syncephalastrum racemosum]|uniref:Uncharacterized protein n=1 Tax=Syncephalastrum racemosum TaxID=13706 RepID=A0A1X2H076_SYNRA|nr:hypothetical protein BCR43DRAFT_111679 [Syncephalastrum racemosum]